MKVNNLSLKLLLKKGADLVAKKPRAKKKEKHKDIEKTRIRVRNRRFVLAGGLWENKDKLRLYIVRGGGHPMQNITASTDYLVVGTAPSKIKLNSYEKAKSNGYRIRKITESQLQKVLEPIIKKEGTN